MSDKMDLIIEKLDSQEKMITQLLQIVGATNNKVANLEKVQAQHTELLNQLIDSQENQEYLLNALSVRSAKQDAEILKLQKTKRNAI
jgi:hypothetical protein